LTSCSDGREAGKPVVDETTNGLQARILLSDSTAASEATVSVSPGWYDSGAPDSANRTLRTDGQGRIDIANLTAGDWWLVASQGTQAVRTLVAWNPGASGSMELVLGQLGRVVGTTVPFAVVRLYGSTRVAHADAAGKYVLDSVAPGLADLRSDIVQQGADSLVGESSMILKPSDTSTAPGLDSISTARATWPQARLAVIPDDSSAGPDSLADFLVPLRIGPDEFATGLGSPGQLMVTDMAGRELEADVEDWNPSQDSGLVWVRVPVVHPLRGDTLRILWGKTGFAAPTPSGGLDSLYGIWHLGAASPLSNAIAAGPAIATDSGTTSETGVLGRGRRFDGGNWMRIPSPPYSWFAQGFTISCWARLDGGQPSSAKILDLGPAGPPYGSILLDVDTSTGKIGMQVASVDSSWQRVDALAAASGWTHLAATWDGTSREAVFYQDGVEQGRVQASAAIQDPAGFDLVLGNQASGDDGIRGLLDEVRWDERVQPPEWIRHLHFTQTPDRIRVVAFPTTLP
jgi:hypothetical protein